MGKCQGRKPAIINGLLILVNVTMLAFNLYFAFELDWFSKLNQSSKEKGEEETYVINHPEEGINNYAQYLDVAVSKEDFSWTGDSTDTKKIINLEYMSQKDFPTGCESVTTVMALRYMGYNITIDEFVDEYLPKFPVSWGNGYMYGEDPNLYFIGDPRNKSSYGCYAPVINSVLVQMAGQEAVHNLTGMDIDDMINHYVSNGIPVIIWTTAGMQDVGIETTWKIERTGESFTFPGREHCLLLAGWDEQNYYFYDPLDDRQIVGYEKELVKKRYAQLGSMAVALVREAFR